MMFKKILITALVLFASTANAAETSAPAAAPAKGHMQIDIPKKWASDNTAGANQGIGIVFYPEGGSWAKSPAVIYVRTIDKVNNSTIRAIDADIANYKETAPQAKLTDEAGLITKDGKIAVVKKLKDDKSGNLEFISYIAQEKDVTVITLNAKTEAEAKKAFPSYKELINSYSYINEGTASAKTEEKKEVKTELKTETKTVVKTETKPAAPKAEVKTEVKAEIKPKEETKK